MGLDMQKAWRALGRPTAFQKMVDEAPEKVISMLETLGENMKGCLNYIFGGIVRGVTMIWSSLWNKSFEFLCIGGIVICIYLGIQYIRSDGAVMYCTVDVHTTDDKTHLATSYNLKGIRSWRADTTMGTFSTFDETVKHAEQVACPLH